MRLCAHRNKTFYTKKKEFIMMTKTAPVLNTNNLVTLAIIAVVTYSFFSLSQLVEISSNVSMPVVFIVSFLLYIGTILSIKSTLTVLTRN